MYKKLITHPISRQKSKLALMLGILLSALTLIAVVVNAQEGGLVSLSTPVRVVVNSSFISPLDEVFGDVLVGKKVFVAGNTVLRAEPDTRICLGNQTNFQDNILFLAKRSIPAPPSQCALKASSTESESASPTKQVSKIQRSVTSLLWVSVPVSTMLC